MTQAHTPTISEQFEKIWEIKKPTRKGTYASQPWYLFDETIGVEQQHEKKYDPSGMESVLKAWGGLAKG